MCSCECSTRIGVLPDSRAVLTAEPRSRFDFLMFTVTTTVAGVPPRTYTRFSDVSDDVVEARILMGIHFRFADTVARRQGFQSADWAFSHILRPAH